MRLLFDVRFARHQSQRGIGRYIFGLIDALRVDGRLKISLLEDRGATALDESTIFVDELSAIDEDYFDFFCLPSYFPDNWANHEGRLGFLLPHQALRISRSVVGIGHDLIPDIFPDIYFSTRPDLHDLFRLGETIASQISSHTFCNSVTTATDFAEYAGCAPTTLTVIYGGVDIAKWSAAHCFPPTENVVYVGGDEYRKNLDGAIAGFAAFKKIKPESRAKLIIIGNIHEPSRSRLDKLIEDLLLPPTDVSMTGFVDEHDLVRLVKSARMTVFPSLYEGLGLPILESLAAGVPCAASNVSSTAELVPPEHQFDPRDPRSIAKALDLLLHDENERSRSIAAGQELLSKVNWTRAASTMIETLLRIRVTDRQLKRSKSRRLAVFSCTPPDRSGIATNSAKVFGDADLFDLFTDVASPQDLSLRERETQKIAGRQVSLWPICAFDDLDEAERYDRAVYVLGNSHHNLPVLQALMNHKGNRAAKTVYLHDGRLENIWFWYCGRSLETMRTLFSMFYPLAQLKSCGTHNEFPDVGMRGIRPLILGAGIRHIVVNSERAKKAIEYDIACEFDVRVDIAHHTIDRIDTNAIPPFSRRRDELIIGTFGIPDNIKGTDRVIAAVREINRSRPARLAIVGWRANEYACNCISPEDRNIVEIVDSPNDAELHRWMKAVDVAVQLRMIQYGESSGVLAQLVGVGKKPIASTNLIDPALADHTIAVDREIPPEQLAEEILNAIHVIGTYDGLEKFSSASLGNWFASRFLTN